MVRFPKHTSGKAFFLLSLGKSSIKKIFPVTPAFAALRSFLSWGEFQPTSLSLSHAVKASHFTILTAQQMVERWGSLAPTNWTGASLAVQELGGICVDVWFLLSGFSQVIFKTFSLLFQYFKYYKYFTRFPGP